MFPMFLSHLFCLTLASGWFFCREMYVALMTVYDIRQVLLPPIRHSLIHMFLSRLINMDFMQNIHASITMWNKFKVK